MPDCLPGFNHMFVVALSVLLSFVCSILSLMLIHDGPVLTPAWLAGANTAT